MAPVSYSADRAPTAAANAQFIPSPGIGPCSNSKCQLSSKFSQAQRGVRAGKYFTVIGTFGKIVFLFVARFC